MSIDASRYSQPAAAARRPSVKMRSVTDNFKNFLQTQLDRLSLTALYHVCLCSTSRKNCQLAVRFSIIKNVITRRHHNDFVFFLFNIDSDKKTLILCVTEDVGECVVRNIVDVIGLPVTR